MCVITPRLLHIPARKLVSEIPVFINKTVDENVKLVCDSLIEVINIKHQINHVDKYISDLLNPINKSIGIFTDDYIETIFLLKFYEKVLLNNKSVIVYLIPKSNIAGNDATYEDVQDILDMEIFHKLKKFRNEKRLIIRNDGPQIGGLNLLKLNSEILQIITELDILDVRGCRAFEMAQGIKKTTYFSFNIIREISESITGIDGESRQMVLIKQKPGQYCFKDFTKRYKNFKIAPSGRKFMVVPFTVYDYFQKNSRDN